MDGDDGAVKQSLADTLQGCESSLKGETAVRKPLLRQSVENFSSLRAFAATPFLFLLLLGCSTKVEVLSEKRARSENSADTEKLHTKVGVDLLGDHEAVSSPDEEASSLKSSGSTIEINGDGNFAVVVEGDLGSDSRRRPSPPPAKKPKFLNTKIPWPTQLRGADCWTLSCYWAVWTQILVAIALMISTANRKEEGGPLWIVMAMLAAAAILLQFLPHADSGIQFIPLSPWSYIGWESFGVSLVCWAAILFAAFVVLDRSLDSPQAFSVLCLIAMTLNVLLSWSAVG